MVILFSMPGTPVIYYGDEIGMGDNFYLGDRNGVRTPMQWSADRNGGFFRANAQQLYLPLIIDPEYHYEALNVEAQQNNPDSLLWMMRRLIAQRKRFQSLGTGSLEFLHVDNNKVLAYLRSEEKQHILVVANLSRFAQYAEVDLSRYKGRQLMELFGRSRLPAVGDAPYALPLAPHQFFWFSLEEPKSALAGVRHEGARIRRFAETRGSMCCSRTAASPSSTRWMRTSARAAGLVGKRETQHNCALRKLSGFPSRIAWRTSPWRAWTMKPETRKPT